MASLGCRVGRLLPTLHRLSRQTITVARAVEVHQSNVKTLVTSSKCNLQAQVTQENGTEEEKPALIKSRIEDKLDRLLYKLDLEMRRSGRLISNDLEEVISLVKRSKFCTSTQALLLIRCCGKSITDETKAIRRERVADLVPTLQSILSLDVSHYNSVLKVNLENEQSINVSEFLGDMESNGVKPNRVTYQHLIGLYCLDGNIAGATTVLEQMKAEDMSINESIFHALLTGHCINNDKESVNETLEVMENSGLLLGSETYTTILTALAKARDWERVEEVLVEANSKDVRLDAGDYFKVIIALCENGMAEQAKPLVSKIPRRAGYFQELRCALPQIILAGQCELAFEIFNGFKMMGSQDDRSRTNHGMFMVRALVNSPTEPNKAAEYIMQMMDNGNTDALGIYAYECISSDKEKHLAVLGTILKEKGQTVPKFDTRNVLRNKMESPEELGRAIRCLQTLGIRVEYGNVAREMIQRNLDLDTHTPGALAQKIKKEIPMIPIGYIQNNMLATLLERSQNRFMQACTGYLLFTRMDNIFPGFWSSHLARSFLRTNSLDDLISIIFAAKIKIKDNPTDMENLYNVLLELDRYQVAYQPEASASAILSSVLTEINKHKLGVPRSTADKINDLMADPELKELLDVAVSDFESDYWTEEKENAFMDRRKELYRKSVKSAGYKAPMNEDRMYNGYFEIPEDLDEMLKIKKILKKRNTFNPKLADMIIRGFGERGDGARCLAELAEAQQTEDTFNLNPVTANTIVSAFCSSSDPEGALKFFTETKCDVFASTYMAIVEAFAKKGDHEKVVELLEAKLDRKLINGKDIRIFQPVVDLYQEAGDPANLQKVVNTIIENRVENASIRPLLHCLVKVHLVRDDVPAALASFTTLVEQYKCLPGKNDLMSRLVREENVEDLQKVIDLSISVIGEELSLYDLTQIFLDEGRRAQAKRMLDTPGLMYNHRAVTNMLETFTKNKQLDCIEDLVKLSKNVFGCDRDYMYQMWVKAVFNKPEVVNEIWMEIQEEGHAPSSKLKTDIAKSLKAGNMEIPFVTTDLDLDGPRLVQQQTENQSKQNKKMDKKEDQKTLKPALTETKKEKKVSEPQAPEVSLVAAAISNNNVAGLVNLLKEDNTRIKDLWDGLGYLTDKNEFAQAIDVIKHVQYKQNKLKSSTSKLIEKMFENNQREAAEAFVAEMPENVQKVFQTNILLANLNAKDPERLYASIKTAVPEDRVKFNIPVRMINEAFTKDAGLKDRLESLAGSGHLPAVVVLGRHACGAADAENLVKHWSTDNREDKARSYVVEIHNIDRLRWIISTLNCDKDVVRVASNQCLAFNKDATKEILEFSIQNGLNLEDVNTSALKRAAALQDFSQSADAARIVNERKSAETTSSS